MRKVWSKIELLIKANALHSRGFRLGEVELPFVLSQAEDEFRELKDAPDDPSEMADLLGVLIHYSIKQGWTMEALESYLSEKLDLRFSESGVQGTNSDSKFCSSPNVELLRRSLKWLMDYNQEWDSEKARELQRDIQAAVDEADGKRFSCETCGNDTDSPEVVCEECQQDYDYDN